MFHSSKWEVELGGKPRGPKTLQGIVDYRYHPGLRIKVLEEFITYKEFVSTVGHRLWSINLPEVSFVEIEVDGKRLRALIDTGASVSLIAKRHVVDNEIYGTNIPILHGIVGEMFESFGVTTSVMQIGEIDLSAELVVVEDGLMKQFDVIIGINTIVEDEWVLDYMHKRIWQGERWANMFKIPKESGADRPIADSKKVKDYEFSKEDLKEQVNENSDRWMPHDEQVIHGSHHELVGMVRMAPLDVSPKDHMIRGRRMCTESGQKMIPVAGGEPVKYRIRRKRRPRRRREGYRTYISNSGESSPYTRRGERYRSNIRYSEEIRPYTRRSEDYRHCIQCSEGYRPYRRRSGGYYPHVDYFFP